MANNENLKPFKKGNKFGKGRPKGSKNRSTIARKWLEASRKAVNPMSLEEEEMSMEDLMTLAIAKKATSGDVAAYKALLDSRYGQAKEQIDVSTDAPSIDFRTLFNFKDDPGTDQD